MAALAYRIRVLPYRVTIAFAQIVRTQRRIRGTSDWSSGVTADSTDPAGGPFGGTVGFNVQDWGLVFGS
ncbi:MAG: hypothetical protein WBD15_15040 [Pseudolabrys sp.]